MTTELSSSWGMRPIDILRDIANTPRRDPLMRDDDIRFGCGLGRQLDAEWFRNRVGSFRILSTTQGDLARAGLLPIADGYRGVRLSKFPGARLTGRRGMHFAIGIIFVIPVSQTEAFNALPDVALEAHWRGVLSAGSQPEVTSMPRGV